MKHGANAVHPQVSSTGRLGYEYYNQLGYVPYNVGINENAARTLEYAYDDWCIYQLGKALNKPEEEIAVYAQRAMNYKNLYDKEHKLMRGKNKDGRIISVTVQSAEVGRCLHRRKQLALYLVCIP